MLFCSYTSLFFVLCMKLLFYSFLKCCFKQVMMENSICLWLLAGFLAHEQRFLRPILLLSYLTVSDSKFMSTLGLQSSNSFLTVQIFFLELQSRNPNASWHKPYEFNLGTYTGEKYFVLLQHFCFPISNIHLIMQVY